MSCGKSGKGYTVLSSTLACYKAKLCIYFKCKIICSYIKSLGVAPCTLPFARIAVYKYNYSHEVQFL